MCWSRSCTCLNQDTHTRTHTTPFQSCWQVNYHLSPWPYNYDSQTDKAHPPWSFFPFFSPTLPLCYPYVSPSFSHLFPTACVRIRVRLIYGSDSRFWFKWQAEWWIYHSLIDYTLLTTHYTKCLVIASPWEPTGEIFWYTLDVHTCTYFISHHLLFLTSFNVHVIFECQSLLTYL